MEYSDDKIHHDDSTGGVADNSVNGDAEYVTMPEITARPKPAPEKNDNDDIDDKPSFAGELVCVAVKTIGVALSFIAMLACILAIGMPLTTMRIFNKFGMSARAVDFGERYIAGELDDHDAAVTDKLGNYTTLSKTSALTNDDFAEALYVCNNLSYRLMNDSYKSGDDVTGKYYAERLEKYTRMYLSLNNVAIINTKTDEKNIAAVPAAVHPAVYSYAHDMRVMNFRARSYLGKTDYMLYDPGIESVITETRTQSATFAGSINSINAQLVDEFVDYVDQLGEYLDVEFLRAGIENDLSKTYTVREGDKVLNNVPVYSDVYLKNYGVNLLKGNEFSLFVYGLDDISATQYGFTSIYNQLAQSFGKYAQFAVDYVPSGANATRELLRQLHWLNVLAKTSQRFWYMESLLYYSAGNFGPSSEAIIDGYGNSTCKQFGQVTYENKPGYRISEVYTIKLGIYTRLFQSKETNI